MRVTHVRDIETPWTPYAVTFSRDGSRLAIGGGSWYGEGGLMLVGVDDDRAELLSWADVRWYLMDEQRSRGPRTASVSGLCFSDDDRFLAASMWSSGQRWAPTMLLDVDGTRLRLRELFNYRGVVPSRIELPRPLLTWRLTATGVLLHDGYIITRRHHTWEKIPDVLILDRFPGDLDIRAANHTQHLTHSRLVVVRDTVITQAEGRYGHPLTNTAAPVPIPKGLEMRDLNDADAPPRQVLVSDYPRITAIAASPGNQGFVIGGNQRQIDEWWWDGAWQRRQLRAADAPNRMPQGGPSEGLEFPGIQAIVTLAGSNTLVAVSAEIPTSPRPWVAGGHLFVRSENGEWASEPLPHAGKPRSLAAHPTRPWVAVGIKQGHNSNPKSIVAILAIEP